MDVVMMEEFERSSDRAMIVRGKRSKRLRQSSPFSAMVTTSSDDGGGGGEDRDGGGLEFDSYIVRSVSLSSEISTSTEEDEDMANCLILLAQSGGHHHHHQEKQEQQVVIKNNKMEKISSRKFTEMSTNPIAKAGIFVYECKTCNRSFPSFQALGGHRASHKKPKQSSQEEKKIPTTSSSNDQEEKNPQTQKQQQEEKEHQVVVVVDEEKIKKLGGHHVSIQIAKKSSISPASNPSSSLGVVVNNKNKTHECSICGLEFSSGQALGGHMRRHRVTTTTTTTNNNNNGTITAASGTILAGVVVERPPRAILQLDLNLPAPEDDHHDSKFQFSGTKQHIFPSPALVDCHY